MTELTRAL